MHNLLIWKYPMVLNLCSWTAKVRRFISDFYLPLMPSLRKNQLHILKTRQASYQTVWVALNMCPFIRRRDWRQIGRYQDREAWSPSLWFWVLISEILGRNLVYSWNTHIPHECKRRSIVFPIPNSLIAISHFPPSWWGGGMRARVIQRR